MSASPFILIVDGDARFGRVLSDRVAAWGYRSETVPDADAALERLADPRQRPDVIVTETHLPPARGATGERGGDTLLRRLPAVAPGVVPLVLTGYGTIADAVAALKLGATDYLTKPLVDDTLRAAIASAADRHALLAGSTQGGSVAVPDTPRGMVGADPAMAALYRVIAAAADGTAPVLVTGEPGVGKDLAARAVHAAGRARAGGPLVVYAAGPVDPAHPGGGADGACEGRHLAGLWAQAAGGSLLVRGVDRLSPAQRTALLDRLREAGRQSTDVRLIATAGPGVDRVLPRPLLDRVAGVRLHVPALRDRPDDLDPLSDHFLKRAGGRARRERSLGPAARHALKEHAWPGNVRELARALEHAVTVSAGPVIGPDDLPPAVVGRAEPALRQSGAARPAPGDDDLSDPAGGWTPTPLAEALLDPERRILVAALGAHGWNRNAAARDLGIDRTTLYKKIKRFGLDRPCG